MCKVINRMQVHNLEAHRNMVAQKSLNKHLDSSKWYVRVSIDDTDSSNSRHALCINHEIKYKTRKIIGMHSKIRKIDYYF